MFHKKKLIKIFKQCKLAKDAGTTWLYEGKLALSGAKNSHVVDHTQFMNSDSDHTQFMTL